jgi:hypothetical protein
VVLGDRRDRFVAGRLVDQHEPGDGRAHAVLVGVVVGGAEDVGVGVGDRGDDVVERRARHAQPAPQQVDRDRRRHLAGAMATHPVGDDEHPLVGEDVVLVLGPDAAGVGGDPPGEAGHYWASSTV